MITPANNLYNIYNYVLYNNNHIYIYIYKFIKEPAFFKVPTIIQIFTRNSKKLSMF